jgi:hypothetical protein
MPEQKLSVCSKSSELVILSEKVAILDTLVACSVAYQLFNEVFSCEVEIN